MRNVVAGPAAANITQHPAGMQSELADVDKDVKSMSMSESSNFVALVCARTGAPTAVAADGSIDEVPAIRGTKMHAAVHRHGNFWVLCTDKGLLMLMEPASKRVLDALQVRPLQGLDITAFRKVLVDRLRA